MDLHCGESMTGKKIALKDPIIYRDDRVLDYMLHLDITILPKFNYFAGFQDDVKPFMRKIVLEWMYEICEEQSCEDYVFPLAVNYFDRYMCSTKIGPDFIQCLGTTSLFLASKMRQSDALPIELLSAYTDGSITDTEIKNCELLVLSKLNWNLVVCTGMDYIDHILERLAWSDQINPLIKRHAQFLVSICCIDLRFMLTMPSMLAACCISSAAQGLLTKQAPEFIAKVSLLTKHTVAEILKKVEIVEKIIVLKSKQFQLNMIDEEIAGTADVTYAHGGKPIDSPAMSPVYNQQPDTPSDIEEIHF